MTSRAVTITGFCVILGASGLMELRARKSTGRVSSAHDVVRLIQRARFGRTGVFVLWFWLGWHFLAR